MVLLAFTVVPRKSEDVTPKPLFVCVFPISSPNARVHIELPWISCGLYHWWGHIGREPCQNHSFSVVLKCNYVYMTKIYRKLLSALWICYAAEDK